MNQQERMDYFAAHATEEDVQHILPKTCGDLAALIYRLGIKKTPPEPQRSMYYCDAESLLKLRYWAKYEHAKRMMEQSP